MIYDFVILTLPRSGSHMLASALDTHPEIQCSVEGWRKSEYMPWLGATEKRVKGTTVFPRYWVDVGAPQKAIVLDRSPEGRCSPHVPIKTLEPYVDTSGPVNDGSLIELEDAVYMRTVLFGVAERIADTLALSYEELTGNEDCREIPEPIGRSICDFLGVCYAPLRPAFYKPTRR